ncbi:MAG: TRAP transporter small permease [Spirochaetota bacterium]
MFHKLERVLTITEETIILLCMVTSLVFVFVNIVLRYLFGGGFVFAEEYARYTMVLLVYMGVSQAIKNGSMIKVDLLTVAVQRLQVPLDIISNILSMVVAVILIKYGYEFTKWQRMTGQTSIAMDLPLWIAYGIVPVGGVLMLVRYTVSTIGIVQRIKQRV